MASLMGKWILLSELIIRSILPPFYSFSLLEKVCKKKLKKRANDINAMWFLSNFYVWYGKHAEAQTQLEALMELGVNAKAVGLLLSKVYFNLGQHRKVVQILSSSEILSDKDRENYYLGISFIELGKFRDAVEYLNKYIKYYPKSYEPFVHLGYAYYMEGLYDLALNAHRQAEKLNPSKKEIKDNINLCIEKLMQNNKKGTVS